MARTSYIIVDPGLEAVFDRSLQAGDRFTYPRIYRKSALLSYIKVKGLTQRSLLPTISEEWSNVTPQQKDAYKVAGEKSGLTSWRLFVCEQCLRKKAGLPGIATPSNYHQGKVGALTLAAPATHLKLVQYHPVEYWISKAVPGKKGMRQPVLITEPFSLPLTIGLSYKTDLVVCGPDPYAKFYAGIEHLYQGNRLTKKLEIVLPYGTDWTRTVATENFTIGKAVSYDLYLEINDLQGTVWIDNVYAEHGGKNWARDPRCDNIKTTFTKVYYQVPAHWAPEILPAGADYFSTYVAS